MNIAYSWLKTLVPDVPSPEELATLLVDLGLGVEEVHEVPAAPEQVVIAEVRACEPIPDSSLHYVTAWDGHQEHKVVCGAPNVALGMRSALALIGCHLPAVNLTIEARDVRGVMSHGMLCSAKELGLFDASAGIIAFGDDAPIGKALSELWSSEVVLELELTPNRADAFSMLGVARDVAAKLGVPYQHPAQGMDMGDLSLASTSGLKVTLTEDVCSRFTLRLIEGVTVKPSPIWLMRRLAHLGMRPRNNIVDITNYVTFELGQPSHAYDLNDLTRGEIVVRKAMPDELIETLYEKTHALSPEDTIITTPNTAEEGTSPIGIGGVVGGLHHSIKDSTTTVALEAAHFDPVAVRHTAKRYGISSDASYRFERGVDPNLPPIASARICTLIAELGGGNLHPAVLDVGRGDIHRDMVCFRPSRVSFLMDFDVPPAAQRRYLEALGCAVQELEPDLWNITPPSWRFDLTIEEDIIEEVARLHGFEHIGETLPHMAFVPPAVDSTQVRLKTVLAGMGFSEAMNYTFTSDAELRRAGAPASKVQLLHPQGADRSVLRTALYPGMLSAAHTNRQLPELALFEVGHVFLDAEEERLCILQSSSAAPPMWRAEPRTDFYVFKGKLEQLAHTLRAEFALTPLADVALAGAPDVLHPGICAAIWWNGEQIGIAGRVHPAIERDYDIGPSFIAEMKLPLTAHDPPFKDYSRQPHAERDLAIIVPTEVSYAALARIVAEHAGPRLESLYPFDVYKGEPLPSGKRSVAMRLIFRDLERALTDTEVDGYVQSVISALAEAGYPIRDKAA